MKQFLVGLLVLLLTTLACTSEKVVLSTPRPATSQPKAARNFAMGVAGLIPRNHPNSTDEDWVNMYEILPETGKLLGIYTAWSDSPETEGNIPEVIDVGFDLAPRYGFTPVAALSYFHETSECRTVPSLNLSDPDQREMAIQVAVRIAERHHPIYLALGVEINNYYVENPSDYHNFVTLYFDTYDAVKAVSPETLVFPIFQYERLRGGEFFTGDNQEQAQWDLILQFGDRLDLIGFTTYPYLLYDKPSDLPNDHYTKIINHTSKAIAFTEIGWPSKSMNFAPESPFGGSEEEQTAFVHRFFELTKGLNLELVMWSFPNDIDPNLNPAFTSISLRHNDGREKPAFEIWQNWVK
jgi:hypothetical protein